MIASAFKAKHLVLLGGGHSHLTVLKSFGMKPVQGVQVTLVTKDVHTPYSGMIPGYVAGFYTSDECHIDLSKLATFANVRLVHAPACGICTVKQEILFRDRPPMPYDCLSIDIGITPVLNSIPGAYEHTTPVKPINTYVERMEALLARLKTSAEPATIIVVGGGAGGTELAFALHHRLSQLEKRASGVEQSSSLLGNWYTVKLVSRCTILPSHPPHARTVFLRLAKERNIQVLEGSAAASVTAGCLHLENGDSHAFEECLWCIQAAPAAWLKDTKLPKASGGFLAINEFLQSSGGPDNVFACGDVATSVTDPRPKAGVFAVRQGPPLAENLRRHLIHAPLQAFRPQVTFLGLISTGNKNAVATRGSFSFEAGWLWTLKDFIDRGFMRKFGEDLPAMTPAPGREPDAIQTCSEETRAAWASTLMRCNGCAAKVSSTVLSRVLSRLEVTDNSSVISGVSTPDDCAVLRPPPAGHVIIQTVDFLRSFTSDPFVFGQIAANHALSDCYAMGARPTSALAMAVVPFASDSLIEDNLFQMMAGANCVLTEVGCSLVGGHSSEGAETSLGFSVTGYMEESKVMSKASLRPGQVLVLTKAVGTGLILKSMMMGLGKGRWERAALDSMLTSNGPASLAMRLHGVQACTDVTGFGLLGHLAEMAKSSQVSISVNSQAVPLLDGVASLLDLGVRSSLHDANSKAVDVTGQMAPETLSVWPALVDPQTSGGLLCSVDEDQATDLIDALKSAGCHAARMIGHVGEDKKHGAMITIN